MGLPAWGAPGSGHKKVTKAIRGRAVAAALGGNAKDSTRLAASYDLSWALHGRGLSFEDLPVNPVVVQEIGFNAIVGRHSAQRLNPHSGSKMHIDHPLHRRGQFLRRFRRD